MRVHVTQRDGEPCCGDLGGNVDGERRSSWRSGGAPDSDHRSGLGFRRRLGNEGVEHRERGLDVGPGRVDGGELEEADTRRTPPVGIPGNKGQHSHAGLIADGEQARSEVTLGCGHHDDLW